MLLWCDGFDHYRFDETLMVPPWSTIGADATLSATRARTGARGLHIEGGSDAIAERSLGAAKTVAGVGVSVWLAALPANDDRLTPIEFRDAAGAAQVAIALTTTGAVRVSRGDASGTVLGESGELVTAQAWNHLEARCVFDQTSGSVEVRLNGATVVHLAGIDTCATANVEASFVAFRSRGNPGVAWDIDDVFAWDTAGSFNTDFLGDKRVFALVPVADTTIADWTPNAGPGFAAIDDDGHDGDATYIEASTAGDVSEFRLMPPNKGISAIAATVTVAVAEKTDVGSATLRASLVSGASVAGAATHALGSAYAALETVIETDPATAAPWTRDGLAAALLRLDRLT